MNSYYDNNSLYGKYYRTRKFTDIFPDVDHFLNDYNNCGIPKSITDDNATTLYYLLYSRYGNSNVASSDEHQFIMKLFSIVFTDGTKWEKRLEIQNKLKSLTDDQVLTGMSTTFKHAYNPGQEGDISNYINDQNTSTNKRTTLTAYAEYIQLFEDVTTEFLSKFKILFLTIVAPEEALWYETEEESKEEN